MAKTTLGEYIRNLRNKRDIGVRELGRLVDVSGVHISSIEKDKNTPSPELLRKIAVILDADVDKLQAWQTRLILMSLTLSREALLPFRVFSDLQKA